MNKQQYDVRCRHSDSWYLSVIQGLLSALKVSHRDKDIATHMNSLSLLSATGNAWTPLAVQQALFKLKHFREKSSHLHNAMLQLHWDGLLSREECLPLIQPRKNRVCM